MNIQLFSAETTYIQQTIVELYGVPLLKRKRGAITTELFQIEDFYVEVASVSSPHKVKWIKCFTVQGIDNYLNLVDISAIQALL